MKQYQMMELCFNAEKPEGSQVIVNINAAFECNGESVTVPGFYAGDGIYKVRFYPKKAGLYKWKVSGIVEASGEEMCDASSEGHGMVKAKGLNFYYEDGTKYLPFGTTVYALIHQEKQLIDKTMQTLSTAPFNKIRFCVFPKHYDYNHNEPEYFAFEKTGDKWDVHRPCFAFWNAMEQRIIELGKMGIQADLILFHPYDRWGFAALSKEECLIYLNYLTRRLSAIPNVWWSLANEYDMMDKFGDEYWAEFAKYIVSHDSYGHLLSNHNFIRYWDFSDSETTHCCIQDRNVDDTYRWAKKYNKPVIYDECCYEGNIPHSWGSISAFEMVNRFWKVCVCGGYCTHGETYMDSEEILWWSKGGTLKGESSERIGFLKELLYSLPEPLKFLKKETSIDRDIVEMLKVTNIPGVTDTPFVQMLLKTSPEEVERVMSISNEFIGHCGDEVFIQYFERMCTCKGTLNLPSNGKYTVEIIDVWEMTRKTVLEGVNGTIEVDLPGKEGIAVIATRASI